MKKNKLLFIIIGIVLAVAIIGVTIYFIIANKEPVTINNTVTETITIENLAEGNKTIEISKKKEIEQLKEIYSKISLEQDETSKYLAIKNDIKIDLNNGILFYLDNNLDDYCYYEDSNTNTKFVIKMPEGLLDFVNSALQK